jgi:hypothetical protein
MNGRVLDSDAGQMRYKDPKEQRSRHATQRLGYSPDHALHEAHWDALRKEVPKYSSSSDPPGARLSQAPKPNDLPRPNPSAAAASSSFPRPTGELLYDDALAYRTMTWLPDYSQGVKPVKRICFTGAQVPQHNHLSPQPLRLLDSAYGVVPTPVRPVSGPEPSPELAASLGGDTSHMERQAGFQGAPRCLSRGKTHPSWNTDLLSAGPAPVHVHGAMANVTRTVEDEEGCGNPSSEPYAVLIYRALRSAPGHKMVLKDIYAWFERHTDKAKDGSKGWQNSIRHNLSMNGVSRSVPQAPKVHLG